MTTSRAHLDHQSGKIGKRIHKSLQAGRQTETKGEGEIIQGLELWLPLRLGVLMSCLYLYLSHSASSLLLPLHLPLPRKLVQDGQ